ncbi:MAG: hypothetical protein ACR2HA_04410, partial [Nocardioides sp.]
PGSPVLRAWRSSRRVVVPALLLLQQRHREAAREGFPDEWFGEVHNHLLREGLPKPASCSDHLRRGPADPIGWSGQPSRPRAVLAAVIAPLGMLAYLGWVAIERGHPLGYFRIADGWGNGFDGGAAFTIWVVALVTDPPHWPGLLVVAGLVALLVLVGGCVRQRQPLPLLVFTAALVVLTLTTSGYFGSKPRYLLPAVPLLLPVALWLSGLPRVVRWAILALAAVGSTGYGTFWLLGDGPPKRSPVAAAPPFASRRHRLGQRLGCPADRVRPVSHRSLSWQTCPKAVLAE